jgi:hypothetical protein
MPKDLKRYYGWQRAKSRKLEVKGLESKAPPSRQRLRHPRTKAGPSAHPVQTADLAGHFSLDFDYTSMVMSFADCDDLFELSSKMGNVAPAERDNRLI